MNKHRGFEYRIEEDNGERYCEAKNETNVVLRFCITGVAKEEVFIKSYIDKFIEIGLKRVYEDTTLINEEYN